MHSSTGPSLALHCPFLAFPATMPHFASVCSPLPMHLRFFVTVSCTVLHTVRNSGQAVAEERWGVVAVARRTAAGGCCMNGKKGEQEEKRRGEGSTERREQQTNCMVQGRALGMGQAVAGTSARRSVALAQPRGYAVQLREEGKGGRAHELLTPASPPCAAASTQQLFCPPQHRSPNAVCLPCSAPHVLQMPLPLPTLLYTLPAGEPRMRAQMESRAARMFWKELRMGGGRQRSMQPRNCPCGLVLRCRAPM